MSGFVTNHLFGEKTIGGRMDIVAMQGRIVGRIVVVGLLKVVWLWLEAVLHGI